MLKLYFQSAFRALRKDKLFSFVSIFGLTLGLAACMIVSGVVINEISYDKHWSKSSDLYRIITVGKPGGSSLNNMPGSFSGLGPELKRNFPELLALSVVQRYPDDFRMHETDEHMVSLDCLNADTSIWSMLDFHVISGNPKKFVAGIDNIVITASTKERFFHGIDPIGKLIYSTPGFDGKSKAKIITGVISDMPANTHLRAKLIEFRKPKIDSLYHTASGTFIGQYFLFRTGTDIKNFEKKANAWFLKYVDKGDEFAFSFQSIKDIYLHSDYYEPDAIRGNYRAIKILAAVTVILLFIACINFINLSTARILSKLHDTGVRKILGASKKNIVFQSLVESLLYFMLSAGLAVGVYHFSIPAVEKYLGHKLEYSFIRQMSGFAVLFGIVMLASMLAGFYPALIISNTKVSGALKGQLFSAIGRQKFWVRKSLVVLQFSISIIVILGMLVVRSQVSYMEKADVGFDRKNLISLGFNIWGDKGDFFKNELHKIPGVSSCSITNFTPPTSNAMMMNTVDDPLQKGHKLTIRYTSGDLDLAKTLGLRLQNGRFLDSLNGDDRASLDHVDSLPSLIPQSTASSFNIHDLNSLPRNFFTNPVGIVNDFRGESFKEKMIPTVIVAERSPGFGGMLIRVKAGTEKNTLAAIEKVWNTCFPGRIFNANWTDEMLINQYQEETRLQQLLTFFGLLTMILAALGIFALMAYSAGQRVKEIGVRKVLGASVVSIVNLLSIDFVKLILIAIIIASPVGWWIMHRWLEDFAYRIQIDWWMFAIAALITFLIAMFTLSIQSIRAAHTNPVDSLRSE